MKTLKLMAFLVSISIVQIASGQDTIYVNHSKTTAIEFPERIVNRSLSETHVITAIKEDNVLTVRASKDFSPSEIRITTDDGADYHFPVVFSHGRAGRFYRLSNKQKTHIVTARRKTPEEEISSTLTRGRVRNVISRDRNSKLKAGLGQISVSGNSLFYKVNIENSSNITYDLDFVRFYVRDLKTTKRTVTQELEIYPVYASGASQTAIPAKEVRSYVFAFNKFPLSKNQALFMEIYEKNGARHLYLKVKPKENEKAKLLKQ